jgi:hypothetical protein
MSAYVSVWPQDRILDYFRFMVGEDADRIDLLRQLADVAVKRPDDWSPLEIRREHEATARESAQRCFCCRTGSRRLYWHHIVAIQHGGDNNRRNLVAICLRCHAAVHPWMDGSKPDKRRGSWSSPRDVMGDMLRAAPKDATFAEVIGVGAKVPV